MHRKIVTKKITPATAILVLTAPILIGSASAQVLDWDLFPGIFPPASTTYTEQGVEITSNEPTDTNWLFRSIVSNWGEGDGSDSLVIGTSGFVPSGLSSSYTFDFDSFTNNGVSDLKFSLFGLASNQNGAGLFSLDDVTLSALDLSGNSVNVNLVVTAAASPTYILSAVGNNVNFLSNSIGTPADSTGDHVDPNSWAVFDFGGQNISSFTIDYQPDIAGSGAGTSSGFALSDMSFSAASVPEPSSAALLGLGVVGLLIRRNR